MKVIGINGSPRKHNNSATLLTKALEGAKTNGSEIELYHLYDLNYKGCRSCFNCKLIDGRFYGHCSLHDDLKPVLESIETADALILSSPIYWRSLTGEMRSFLERLMFPFVTYTEPFQSILYRKIKTAFIYTMNNNETDMKANEIDKHLAVMEYYINFVLGPLEKLYSWDTYQFDDYSKYLSTRFDPVKKKNIHDTQFPIDCQNAFELGKRMSLPN